MDDTRVGGQRPCFRGENFWRIAFLAAIGSLGALPQAEAAIYYWQESGPGVSQSVPFAPPRQSKARRKAVLSEKESAKPQGPLIISISITEQRLRLYDANGLFAESPVSTGVPDHPTPMGVFSVIQKQKFHQSNIYSGAPMPFMQRITWSGIALHAGVVPGHPASHGCIRMPAAFAVKMWNWTRMGARVIVTPGPVSPVQFSHPLLAAVKAMPQPVTTRQPTSDIAIVQEKAPMWQAPVATEAKVELRSTIWHEDHAKPVAEVFDARPTPPTQTADASSTLPSSTSMSDAAPGEGMSHAIDRPASDKQDTSSAAVGTDFAASEETGPIGAKRANGDEPTLPDDKAASDSSANSVSTSSSNGLKSGEADLTSPPKAEAVVNAPAQDAIKSEGVNPQPIPKADPTALIKRSGQIAVFVSRKDSKLYVRQNFSPLFDLPVTIAADERPLGTHIFTARVDRSDANVLHWSVISLPAPIRLAERLHENERLTRGHKVAKPAAIEVKAHPVPDSPAEALDRINLPAETMARIFEAISTGGSIIVSDQGIAAGETGEGTDFIVSLR